MRLCACWETHLTENVPAVIALQSQCICQCSASAGAADDLRTDVWVNTTLWRLVAGNVAAEQVAALV
jgi:hypothetical protein